MAAPVGDRSRVHRFALERQIGGDAEARGRRAALEERREQRVVAVGRLHEKLRFALLARADLPLADAARKPDFHRDAPPPRSEEHTSELQSLAYLVCRLLLAQK